MTKTTMAKILFFIIVVYALSPYGNSAIALFSGIILASFLENPFKIFTKTYTSKLLQICIIGLGAGMNLMVVGSVGAQGVGYTVVGITLTALAGFILSKLLKTDFILSTLITIGTAICGGSAIAATSPILKADNETISISLGVVFILNALALFIFPPVGHMMDLSQHQFGLWSALAIHDTSSVVGAAMQYGPVAVEYATTVKLARALWIIPISLGLALLMKSKNKVKIPWFIFGFILAAALVTWIPDLKPAGDILSTIAKRLLIVTLFFIGLNLNWSSIKKVGPRPLLLGVLLWLIVGSGTLLFIKLNIIS